MIHAAKKLSEGLDYLRVDFMIYDDLFLIGELTIYSSSGMKPFAEIEYDEEIGDGWILPEPLNPAVRARS
jgi:hypothetical protein